MTKTLSSNLRKSNIAFEMVRQLEDAGEEIAFFGILDTWPDENTRYKSLFFADLALRRLQKRDGLTIKNAVEKFRSKLLRRTVSGPRSSAQEPQLRLTKTLVQRYWPGKDFCPPSCSSAITVFKVERQNWFRKRDRKLGWADRTSAGVKVEKIPGDHFTYMRQPQVRQLAALLAKHLDKVCRKKQLGMFT